MISKSMYENLLLKEIRGLSDRELSKVIKTIHFLKEEILQEKCQNVADVLRFCGVWKDLPRKDLQIFSEILKEREKFSEGRAIIE